MRVIQIEIPYVETKRKNAATCVEAYIMFDATDDEVLAFIQDRRTVLERKGYIPMDASRAVVRKAGEFVRGKLVLRGGAQ